MAQYKIAWVERIYLRGLNLISVSNLVEQLSYGQLKRLWNSDEKTEQSNTKMSCPKPNIEFGGERRYSEVRTWEVRRVISDDQFTLHCMSVGFTEAPFLVAAFVWFIFFALCLFVICLVFTIAAITGSCILYIGQGRFYSSTRSVLKYVVRQANITIENLRNVSDYLDSAKRFGADANALASGIQNDIVAIQTEINTSASFLSEEARKNSKRSRHVLNAT